MLHCVIRMRHEVDRRTITEEHLFSHSSLQSIQCYFLYILTSFRRIDANKDVRRFINFLLWWL